MHRVSLPFVLAVALVALQGPGVRGADPLATCSGHAPTLTGTPQPGISLAALCETTFGLAAITQVTVSLGPQPGFTGTLEANVRRADPPDGRNVKGVFAGGTLVYGVQTQTMALGPGAWTFEVRAGNVPPCAPLPVPPGVPNCPPAGAAAGDFGGSVAV